MIFVDTGAWIALTDKSDHYHLEANQIYAALKQRNPRFVTTDYIIDETVTRLRYDANHQVAVTFLDSINRSEETGFYDFFTLMKWCFRKLFRFFVTMIQRCCR